MLRVNHSRHLCRNVLMGPLRCAISLRRVLHVVDLEDLAPDLDVFHLVTALRISLLDT